jgi:hypothetical protein
MGATPNVIVKPSVLTPQRLSVSSEGERVLFTVGDSTLAMHYEDALKVSQWLRVRAKEAKKRAGDVSRHWSVVGTLEDLNDLK